MRGAAALSAAKPPLGRRLLFGYYVGTAGFMALDFIAGLNLRLVFLDDSTSLRLLYYLFCFACLALIWWRPSLTSLVATVESVITVAGLIIDMWLRIFSLPEVALMGGAPVTGREVINFVISGGAAYIGLRLRANRLKADLDAGNLGG